LKSVFSLSVETISLVSLYFSVFAAICAFCLFCIFPKRTFFFLLIFLLLITVLKIGRATIMEGPQGFRREIESIHDEFSELSKAAKIWLLLASIWGIFCWMAFKSAFMFWGIGSVVLIFFSKGVDRFILSCRHVEGCRCFVNFDRPGNECYHSATCTCCVDLKKKIEESAADFTRQAGQLETSRKTIQELKEQVHQYQTNPRGFGPPPPSPLPPSPGFTIPGYYTVRKENQRLREEVARLDRLLQVLRRPTSHPLSDNTRLRESVRKLRELLVSKKEQDRNSQEEIRRLHNVLAAERTKYLKAVAVLQVSVARARTDNALLEGQIAVLRTRDQDNDDKLKLANERIQELQRLTEELDFDRIG
jgi:hypothetical protein